MKDVKIDLTVTEWIAARGAMKEYKKHLLSIGKLDPEKSRKIDEIVKLIEDGLLKAGMVYGDPI